MNRSSESSTFGRIVRFFFWFSFGLFVFLAMVTLIGRGIFRRQTQRDWERAVAEVEAVDPRWRWELLEAEREPIPESENSAIVLARLLKRESLQCRSAFSPVFDAEPSRPVPDNRADVEPLPMPDPLDERSIEGAIDSVPLNQRLPARLARDLDRLLRRLAPEVTEALAIADRPRGRHPLTIQPDFISTLLPTQGHTWPVGRLLALEAMRRAEADEPAAAMRALRALLNTARSFGDEPLLVSWRMRSSLIMLTVARLQRVLGQTELDETDLATFQRVLEEEAAEPRLWQALRGERAGMIMVCEALSRGDSDWPTISSLSPHRSRPNEGPPVELAIPLLAQQARPQILRLFTEMIDVLQRPTPEWKAALSAIEQRIRSSNALTQRLLPEGEVIVGIELQTQARLRSAWAALAAERFRRQTRRWPTSLTELVDAKLLAKVPVDPSTGERLPLTATPRGLQVGGDDPEKGFPLFDANQRRQPAPGR